MTTTQSFCFIDSSGREESATRRANPDGTIGGWIASTAKVHPSAIVEPDAVVEPGATVGPGVRIKNGEIIFGSR